MTDVKPISPTQIKTWQTCQRKWGYAYLEGKREPPTASTELGTAVHAHLERAYRDGTLPTAKEKSGEIALAYLASDDHDFVCGRNVETPFTIGERWRGVIDILSENTVRDHKTTSDLKWSLTEATLLTDPQGVIYAQAVFEGGLWDSANLQWHYVTTRPPYKTKKVHLTVLNDEEHQKRFARLEDINTLMQSHHASGSKADDLPRTESACTAYGGCFHRSYCHPSPSKAIDLNMEHPTNHPNPALARAKADGWDIHPRSSLWMYKPSNLKQPVVKVDEIVATYEKILAQEAAAAIPAIPALPDIPAEAPPQAINPPVEDFVPPTPAVSSAPKEPEAEAPKPRGRPRKVPETTGNEAPIQPGDIAKGMASHAAANAAQAAMPTSDVRVLYVDCIPMNFSRPTDLVRMMLEEACPAIEQANEVAHWKQIPFGGGTAALAVAARQVLAKTRGDLFLDTRTEEGSAILATAVHFMNAQGGVVVRGFR